MVQARSNLCIEARGVDGETLGELGLVVSISSTMKKGMITQSIVKDEYITFGLTDCLRDRAS